MNQLASSDFFAGPNASKCILQRTLFQRMGFASAEIAAVGVLGGGRTRRLGPVETPQGIGPCGLAPGLKALKWLKKQTSCPQVEQEKHLRDTKAPPSCGHVQPHPAILAIQRPPS